MKKEFNPKEYEAIRKRRDKLEERVKRDVEGPEKETAKKLLERVKKKLEEYERIHDIPKDIDLTNEEYTSSGSSSGKQTGEAARKENDPYSWNPRPFFKWEVHFEEDIYYRAETRNDEELMNDLGVLFLIFGSTYQTQFNYHDYKVRLLKQIDDKGAFARVKVNVYEDNVLICKEIVFGLWAASYGDVSVNDTGWESYETDSFRKYDNGCAMYLKKILCEMKDLWNSYSAESDTKLLGMRAAGYIGTSDEKKEIEVSMSKKERRLAIRRFEDEIDIRLWNRDCTKTIWVGARKRFDSLEDFLENSGVVYKLTRGEVQIWDEDTDRYYTLVGYGDYNKMGGGNHVLHVLQK